MLDAGKFSGKLGFAVAATVLLAASGLAWSMSRPSGPGLAVQAQATTASAISPTELLLERDRTLPTENWDSF
jgi:hypothetical protein